MQISSNYSMNGVPYENRRRQKDILEFSTERAKQENKNINPYMEDTDFNEKAFDMIGPNAPQDVKDACMEAAKEVNANGMGIKKNGMLSHISQMMIQRLNKQMKGEGDVDNIDILGNTTESAYSAFVPSSVIYGSTFHFSLFPYNSHLLPSLLPSMHLLHPAEQENESINPYIQPRVAAHLPAYLFSLQNHILSSLYFFCL